MKVKTIASRVGIHRCTVGRILAGRAWKHTNVRKTGQEIESKGMAFGDRAPKAARATPCKLYELKGA